MTRQGARPVIIDVNGGSRLVDGGIFENEAELQWLIHEHPEVLPIAEIDRAFLGAIPICRELATPAGPIDNFLVTPDGMPVLVECKLWRNPQARREVVGQALDYAKELSKWTSADIDREVRRRCQKSTFSIVKAAVPDADEVGFHDTLSRNLAHGRCLLLIVGDGIREGVEAIFEHLRMQAILHFSFGLVELPVYFLPTGERIALPRVVAKASVEIRRVVELPPGLQIEDAESQDRAEPDRETVALGDERQAFWNDFLAGLDLDDPEQPIPRAPRQGHIAFTLPAPQGSAWITVFRDISKGEVGLFLSCYRDTMGHEAVERIIDDWDGLRQKVNGSSRLTEVRGKRSISEKQSFGELSDPMVRNQAFTWLRERVNSYVNAFRPAIRSALADLGKE